MLYCSSVCLCVHKLDVVMVLLIITLCCNIRMTDLHREMYFLFCHTITNLINVKSEFAKIAMTTNNKASISNMGKHCKGGKSGLLGCHVARSVQEKIECWELWRTFASVNSHHLHQLQLITIAITMTGLVLVINVRGILARIKSPYHWTFQMFVDLTESFMP